MIRFVFLTALATALGLSTTAQADDRFECQIKQLHTNGGWLPEEVVVLHKADQGIATVNDPIIHYYLGAPTEAKVETDNAKRVSFTWEVQTKSATGQYANMRYRLTIIKNDLAASMSASPGRFPNTYSSSGTCKLVQS